MELLSSLGITASLISLELAKPYILKDATSIIRFCFHLSSTSIMCLSLCHGIHKALQPSRGLVKLLQHVLWVLPSVI